MELGTVILRVSDVDRAKEFWSDGVGLGVIDEMPGYVFLDGGPIPIVLSAIEAVVDESLTEIVFRVDDVHAVFQSMTDRGVAFEGDLRTIMTDERGDLVAGSFRDPDGHYGAIQGWVT